MNRPQPDEFPPFYQKYIDTVGDDVLEELRRQPLLLADLLDKLPEYKHAFAYAPGKWTIKEVIGHIIDTERVMAYRLLCISRGEKSPLPGFDENSYVTESTYSDRTLPLLIKEFEYLRGANLMLIESLTMTQLDRAGVANENAITAKALVFIIAGHLNHHAKIITERYF